MNKRKTPCKKPSHYCASCHKGLSSAQSLWQHKQTCEKMPEAVTAYEDIPRYDNTLKFPDNDASSVLSLGTLNKVVNGKTETYPSMQMKPYMEIRRPDVNNKRIIEDNDQASSSSFETRR